ncbi:MAG: phage Gp37/Gp68 family protein [Elusimicrobia bacterium]|nr:phage Gp37/Gp68 family protein [Elusimicrobiota bacterium]
MALNSNIEWTDATWNPVTGCTKISPGCKHCYAERFAERFRGVPGHPFEQGFDLKLWPERLGLPFLWKQPKRIFVNSMSDLFHKAVPDDFIAQVFQTMLAANHHIYQVLTKRSERMMMWVQAFCKQAKMTSIPPHIWLGVSVESEEYVSRMRDLQRTPAAIRFLSIEPLIGPVNLNKSRLKGIHWVIVGGESGPEARPMRPDWAQQIRQQCHASKVAFFFKQWGAYNAYGEFVGKKAAGRELNGKFWDEMPSIKTGELLCR